MIGLNVEFDKNKYADVLKKVSVLANEAEIKKAINRAAKRAADSAKTETKKQLGSEYTLPDEEVKGTITTRSLSGGGASMHITSSPFASPKFEGTTPKRSMPPAKGPVHVQYKTNGGAKLARAFVMEMKNGHMGVYERSDDKRFPIEQHFGPATPGMFNANEKVNEAVVNKAGETFQKRVIHELERLMYG